MDGGEGGDTYYADVATDVISDTGTSGTDLVNAAVSGTLENLTLTGSALNGTGNAANNAVTCNA